MLAPMARMRAILQKNNLSVGWDPKTADVLLDEIQRKVTAVRTAFANLEQMRVAHEGDPVPPMQALQDDLGALLIATLLIGSQAGLDSALLFTLATTAEAEGRNEDSSYAGIARSALGSAWGMDYADLLGLPVPRKD